MTDQDALLALNVIPGLGMTKVELLLKNFNSPAAIWDASYEELAALSLPRPIIENIVHFSKDKFLEHEYNQMRVKGVIAITRVDTDYPCSLKEIPSAPLVLYVKGDPQILSTLSVGMVGSRISGFYGRKITEEFAADFARAGLCVVSGMARGIDTSAHKGCLKAKGKTVAVLGCGLNSIYPQENRSLFEEIANNGAVISGFPMDVPPVPANFPRRNRIISGLSKAVVVIEAAQKSGALITVDFALEQGRSVFAVPGPVDQASSKGTNQLIKDGAKMALSAADVLEDIGLEFQNASAGQTEGAIVLTSDEHKGYAILSSQPLHIDELALNLKWTIAQVQSVMLNLELKNVVRQLPGQMYVRL